MPFKRQTKMRQFKAKNGESVIPHGCYCYDEKGVCPYWELVEEPNEEQEDYMAINDDVESWGYCWFLEEKDCILLWDQCKICGVKDA